MMKSSTMHFDRQVSQALQMQAAGDYELAAGLFQTLLQTNPQHPIILGYLAVAYTALNRNELALETLDEALAILPNDTNLLMQRAYVCKHLNLPDQAILAYQQLLNHNPNHAKAHNNLAKEFAAKDQYSLALQHYCRAVNCDPTLVPAHFNLGILFLKQGEWVAAETQFRNVIALDAQFATAYFYLGTLYLKMDQLDKAEAELAQLLVLMPDHVEGWVNRGVVALKQRQEQTAIEYFTQALLLDNRHLEARNNMAATLIHFDRYEAALSYYTELVREDPENVEYRYNSGVAHMGLGHLPIAQQLFNQVLVLDPRHFGALSNLAAIQMRLGDRKSACALLERALEIQPQDPASRFMLQAMRGGEEKPQACLEYVQDLFNHYAVYYDPHMENVLQYRVPQRLWELFHQRDLHAYPSALDLGCGTGLIGRILRPLSQQLTGVDLAAKMLAIARTKGIYDELVEADILRFVQQSIQRYDRVVAADVLPYLSDLSPLFQALVPRLNSKAEFWFTTEISKNEPWALQSSMRFCHHAGYIHTLCQHYGWVIIHQETLVARKQDDQNLSVYLFGIRQQS